MALKEELEAVRAELEQVKTQLKAIQELPQIKQLLEQYAPLDVVLNIADAPFKGKKDAAITVVEFADFQCGYCARHVTTTLPQLDQTLIAAGMIKYVYVNYPLPNHPLAAKAAEAAMCANDQGRFVEMHDYLYKNNNNLQPADLFNYASTLGMEMTSFQSCMDTSKHAVRIQADMDMAEQVRINGTPHFAVGYTINNGNQVHVVKTLRGAQPFNVFEQTINELLAGQAGTQ
jgi:protein-disulfide isomerase